MSVVIYYGIRLMMDSFMKVMFSSALFAIGLRILLMLVIRLRDWVSFR